MIVQSATNSTIYFEDIDLSIFPETNTSIDQITLAKSLGLQKSIKDGLLKVVKWDKKNTLEKAIVNSIRPVTKQTKKDTIHVENMPLKGIPVCIKGIFYEAGGYGKVNRYLAKSLKELGFVVSIDPIKGQNQLNEDELTEVIEMEETKLPKDHIKIDSIIPSFTEMSSGKHRIIYTTIEAHSIPDKFAQICDSYQTIIVTSPFAKSVLEKKLPNREIFVIPTGVDPDYYNESIRPIQFNPPLKKFVFLSVFGWSYRKGYDLLFKSYFNEFSAEDDVSLLVLSRYMQSTKPASKNKILEDIENIAKGIKNSDDLPHFQVASNIFSEKNLAKIYKSCHAFVLVSRGESTCLPPCEASLCGLPVIMTDCCGQKTWLNNKNSYLLPIDKLEMVQPGTSSLHYWDNELFPSLKSKECISNLSTIMRHVYTNYEEAKNKNKNLQKLLLSKFQWKHAALQMKDVLEDIWKKRFSQT